VVPNACDRKRTLSTRPRSYQRQPARRYPVAYYLHGLWGDETNWTTLGRLHETLDSLVAAGTPELIVVMPDGDDAWYTTWNSLGDYAGCQKAAPPQRPNERVEDYCVPWPHYDDYVARDLVQHVDSTYRTLANRAHRGIAGLSMGGFGALTIAFGYPDVFSVAASHSGAISLLLMQRDSMPRYAASGPELQERHRRIWWSLQPAFGRDTSGWWARDPARLALRLAARDRFNFPALYLDVGTEDPLLDHSRALPLAYHERSGAHDWPYWRRNAPFSVTFLARRLTPP
jgi:S-formylglutathione hydrolase FrmB